MLKQYFVRLHMGLILLATMASGLLTGKLLFEFGVHSVLLRYPLAVLAAYGLFLGMTRLWIRYTVVNRPSPFSIGDDAVDRAMDLVSEDDGAYSDEARRGLYGGGDSGGGGASDTWEASAARKVAPARSSSGGSFFSGGSVNIDLDEGIWILLALVAVIAAIFGAGAYLIWAAPEILPEIAVGALLASSLKRPAQRAESAGWLHSVISCTAIPFGIVFVMVCALAYAVHHTCPGAPRMIDALHCRGGVR